MKRVFVWIVSWMTLSASAEVITMDLATATDMNGNPITYNTSYGDGYYDGTDVWDSTYNDNDWCRFIYTNGARFILSHIPSMNAYNGMSWEGLHCQKCRRIQPMSLVAWPMVDWRGRARLMR